MEFILNITSFLFVSDTDFILGIAKLSRAKNDPVRQQFLEF
jgi:hypothetical protein